MTPQVLIVEDHPLYRAALQHLVQGLSGQPQAVVATCAEEGLRLTGTLPHLRLILLDFNLPGADGTEAIAAFRTRCPSVPIAVVSASEDRQEAKAALRAGARAFVSKAVPAEVVTEVAQRLLAGSNADPEWISTSGTRTLADESSLALTPRQRDILELLSQGHSNKEIGLRLGLAEITVKVHVSSLFRVLEVVNRTQAVLAARRLGLTQ